MILLEDNPVRVTRNLYDAIMALRPLKEPLVIWIDSLSPSTNLIIKKRAGKLGSWQTSTNTRTRSLLGLEKQIQVIRFRYGLLQFFWRERRSLPYGPRSTDII
ncbi:hypothetical protein K505DRAFT_399825 [Melanomma pulvis-pyrius CBS 109.77]|uniref:Uncharacterized protein n=1 Tax=Melanomma pulvis-pyrius CBS 109.77 TaxID=1314802 RepID=A0A6A6XKL8_9PLEO|nr:hypothetical protein K505DRAFT_399825 [Melanomma pulvis-pyrius CBS 109.77]